MTYCKVMSSSHKRLEFAPGIWSALMEDLRRRGRGRRESGAFLFAEVDRGDRIVRTWLPYDVLAPESLAYDYVRLESDVFSHLWVWCEEHRVEVVADVHTHPLGPKQSVSDRAHPMVALRGHVALIVPRFAQLNPRPADCSFNVYLGDQRWASFLRKDAENLVVAP